MVDLDKDAEMVVIVKNDYDFDAKMLELCRFGGITFMDRQSRLVVFIVKSRFIDLFKLMKGIDYVSHTIKKGKW